jgi:hypothetical protein
VRVELALPNGDRQRLFRDYLNAALRKRTASYTGSAEFTGDGNFQSSLVGLFPVGTTSVQLNWIIASSKEGGLLHLDVSCPTADVSESTWATAVYAFVNSVLAATLADRRSPFFKRSLFYYIGVQLDGEYWLPGCRFAPAFPDDPQPHLINAERPVVFDMTVQAIDDQDASVIAGELSRRYSARLSLLLDVGFYSQDHAQRWAFPTTDGRPTGQSVRCFLGFSHPSLRATEMPKKGVVCPLGAYRGSLARWYQVAGELLSLPPQARRILCGVDSASPAVTEAFDRGARLYQVATVIGAIYPSVALAYRVAAVEAMSKCDSKSGFSEFMRRYVTSTSELDGVIDYLYGTVRSGHFHSGEFPMGEFAPQKFFDPLMDSESIARTDLRFLAHKLTREAIVNWLYSIVPTISEDV